MMDLVEILRVVDPLGLEASFIQAVAEELPAVVKAATCFTFLTLFS